ncbi:hypothetical protein A0H81_09452 [Grifola frondosa]|uniref:F-box domain-containing protein n=1 Tax=Grifola frondosa TaxID=5627 RepID=A0A1C7M1L5_GRIFR|nr:hypothetical protein A0H81_09452 [Grifola frondosa]
MISTPARFQTLEKLEVLTDLEQGTLLFAIMSAPMLRSLELTFSEKLRIKQFRRFLDLVCPKLTSCSHLALHVRLSRNRDPQSLMYILTPLLMLKDLRTISASVTTSPGLSLSDQDIIDLAVAWPRAKVIELDYEYSSPPLVTSLVHFAQHCPDLTSLTLPCMDFSLVSISKRDYPILSHGLIRLDIGEYCSIPDPVAAALFLHCIFPKVESELFGINYSIEVPDCWSVFINTLDALKFARERESVRQAPSNYNSNSSD